MAGMRMAGMGGRKAVGRSGAEQPKDGRARLAPEQPGAEQGDQHKARDLEEPCRIGHRHGGAAQHEIGKHHDDDRRQPLQQRRDEGQQDATLQRHFVGDHVGRDHRLTVAGSGGVEDAVKKAQRSQHPYPESGFLREPRFWEV